MIYGSEEAEHDRVLRRSYQRGICWLMFKRPLRWLRMLIEELHWSFFFGIIVVYGVSQGLSKVLGSVDRCCKGFWLQETTLFHIRWLFDGRVEDALLMSLMMKGRKKKERFALQDKPQELLEKRPCSYISGGQQHGDRLNNCR
ncbi:unnamed protein product [Brassica oleracea var. botrytis]